MGSARAGVVDYPNGSDNGGTIVLTDNSTQLQVLTGSAIQSGGITDNLNGFGFEKIGGGTLIISGSNDVFGTTTISAGTLQAGSGTAFSGGSDYVVASGATLDLAGFTNTVSTLSGDGIVESRGGVATLFVGFNTGTSTFNGILRDGVGGGLGLEIDSNNTLTLGGNSTYSGSTFICNCSTLKAGSTTGLSANSDFVIDGTLDLNGFSSTIGSLTGIGTVKNDGASAAVLTFGGNNLTGSFDGNVIDGIGGLGLTVTGTDSTFLSGNNTYSGVTTINSGATLIANSTTGLSLKSSFVVDGTLDIFDNDNTIAGLSGTGTILNNGFGIATLTVIQSGDSSFDGVIEDGSGLALTIGGTGTLTLTGANTYTGPTTLLGGTLQVSADGNLGFGDLIFDGGTLKVDNAAFFLDPSRLVTVAGGGGTLDVTDSLVEIDNDIDGAGHLTVQGANGFVAFFGNNSYLGGTTVTGGATLVALDDANFGDTSGGVTLDNGTLLFFDDVTLVNTRTVTLGAGGGSIVVSAFASEIAGTITGSGALTVTVDPNFGGGGDLYLTGINDYTGGTVLRGDSTFLIPAILIITDDRNLGAVSGGLSIDTGGLVFAADVTLNASRAISITGEGALFDTETHTVTIAGQISGGGPLGKDGTGTLILTADNALTGDVDIVDGTLQLGNGGTTGSLATTLVTSTGILAFNRSNTLIFAADIEDACGCFGGAVAQIGSGTTILTGDNTYTGGTTISAGILQIGDGGASGSIAGDILDDAALVFNRSDAVTFGGAISGSGSLTKLGGGTLTLTGGNTYDGATNVQGGTLFIDAAAALPAATDVTVSTGATLKLGDGFGNTIKTLSDGTGGSGSPASVVIGASDPNTLLTIGGGSGTNTFSGRITGAGSLSFKGGGTWVLAGLGSSIDNGLTVGNLLSPGSAGGLQVTGSLNSAGTTVVLDGTLTVSNGGILASGSTGIVSGLAGAAPSVTVTGTGSTWNVAGGLAVGDVFGSAASTVTVAGGGTLKITTSNLINIGAHGVLNIGSGAGAGTIDAPGIQNDGQIVANFDTTANVNLSAGISGSGTLAKSGAGALTLSGVNSYTGATTVSAGTLTVNGSIGSSSGVTVQSGATLAGTGTVSTATIQSGAALTPGDGGAGTLTVNGNLSLASGSAAAMEFSPGGNDKISVTGTASLNGSLFLLFATGQTYSAGQYTLITSTGLLSGTFAAFNTLGSPSGFDTALAYDSHDVFLTLTPSTFIWSAAPGSSDWKTPGNWTLGVVPGVTNTAVFDATSNATVTVSQATSVKSLQFNSGAPAYTFNITGSTSGAASLTVATGGIVDNAANHPVLTVGGVSGNVGTLSFNGSGNAADAILTAGAFGTVNFNALTDAGADAALVAGSGGIVDFTATSGANADNKVSAGSIAGAGTFKLGSNTLTVGTLGTSTDVSGVITGSGGLTKTGAGTLTLSGTSTYTGATTISAGVLSVNGAIASTVTLAGGTLKGNGTVGGIDVGGGTLAPGNSIGTLNTGSLTFASGSTYQVEVNAAGQSDLINATGLAALNGTVQVLPASGNYGPVTIYRIINAGSISGTFNSVSSSVSTLSASLIYGATTVDLKLVRNDVAFGAAYGVTPNQIATGGGISAGGAGTALYAAVANAYAPASINATLDSMSGEIHASLRSAMIEDSRMIRDAVLDRLAVADNGFWSSVFAGYGELAGDGNAAELHRNQAGFIAGYDLMLGDGLRAGLAGVYSEQRLNIAARASRASGSGGAIIGYAAWQGGAWHVDLGGDYGWGSDSISRSVAALAETETGSQNSQSAQFFTRVSYDLGLTDIPAMPYFGLAHVAATSGAFAESGGLAALSGAAKTDSQTYIAMGVRLTMPDMNLNAMPLKLHADLGWSHALEGRMLGQVVSFSTGQSFTVLGAPIGSDAATVQLGADLAIAPAAIFSFGYDASLSNRGSSHAVRGGLEWRL